MRYLFILVLAFALTGCGGGGWTATQHPVDSEFGPAQQLHSESPVVRYATGIHQKKHIPLHEIDTLWNAVQDCVGTNLSVVPTIYYTDKAVVIDKRPYRGIAFYHPPRIYTPVIHPAAWEALLRHELLHIVLHYSGHDGNNDHSNSMWEQCG